MPKRSATKTLLPAASRMIFQLSAGNDPAIHGSSRSETFAENRLDRHVPGIRGQSEVKGSELRTFKAHSSKETGSPDTIPVASLRLGTDECIRPSTNSRSILSVSFPWRASLRGRMDYRHLHPHCGFSLLARHAPVGKHERLT
jgi:hypothetical protein